MRRIYWTLPAVAVGFVATFLVLVMKPAPSSAGRGHKDSSSPAGAAMLPVTQAVLYSSGVGYFQREGEVEGDARIDLSFPVQDINDLLKSMVVQDLNGGHIAAVSYDSQAPIDKTLQSYAIDFTHNPSFGAILNQARGEKVELFLEQSNAPVTGTIIGVEKQKHTVGKEVPDKEVAVDVEYLNLWCAEGMRSFRLSAVQRVRFLNAALDQEVRRALETLSLSHDTQKKVVALNCMGAGKRRVRAGYVIENPIWKTSYRLVLNPQGKPLLQGWAMVENISEEDWKDVHVTLVSGRPISFRMDLYQALFVNRPLVEPELFASLSPQTYSGGMDEWRTMGRGGRDKNQGEGKDGKQGQGKSGGRIRRLENLIKRQSAEVARGPSPDAGQAMDLQQGVTAAATAGQLGDYFQYRIEHPVTLPRQKSAMLPIVQKEVEADRLSIYNQNVQAKHPLLGLRFKNTTDQHLMQGPITVFEKSSYAGDARVLDLQPNEERLISYAIDLGTEVEPVVHMAPQHITKIKINKGILQTTTRLQEDKTYNIKNRSEHDRTVLLEHPYRPEFTLVVKDKPLERTREVYRFELKIPAGKTAKQTVTEERIVSEQIVLNNLDDQGIYFYLKQPVISEQAKSALRKVLELKNKLAATWREIQHLQQQLGLIAQDQNRLHENLKEMPPTAAAYKRYLDKFDKQETEIENYQARVKKLQEIEQEQRKELEAYLSNLNVE